MCYDNHEQGTVITRGTVIESGLGTPERKAAEDAIKQVESERDALITQLLNVKPENHLLRGVINKEKVKLDHRLDRMRANFEDTYRKVRFDKSVMYPHMYQEQPRQRCRQPIDFSVMARRYADEVQQATTVPMSPEFEQVRIKEALQDWAHRLETACMSDAVDYYTFAELLDRCVMSHGFSLDAMTAPANLAFASDTLKNAEALYHTTRGMRAQKALGHTPESTSVWFYVAAGAAVLAAVGTGVYFSTSK